jgi:repressor LexA
MTLQPLTPRQREVLDFIQATVRTNGVSPTIQEICDGLVPPVHAISTAWKHIDTLIRKGYVRRRPNRERAIELLTPGRHCATCTCPAEHSEAKPTS